MGHGNVSMPTAGSTGTEGNWSWMDFGCHETDAVAVTVAIAVCTVTVRTWAQCTMPEISLHQHPKRIKHMNNYSPGPHVSQLIDLKKLLTNFLFGNRKALLLPMLNCHSFHSATFASDEVFIKSIPPIPNRNTHDHCKNIAPLGIVKLRCKSWLIY